MNIHSISTGWLPLTGLRGGRSSGMVVLWCLLSHASLAQAIDTGDFILQKKPASGPFSLVPITPVNDGVWTIDGSGNPVIVTTLPQSAITGLTAGLGNKQPLDSDLTAISSIATSSFGRSLLDELDASTLRATAGLVIGTDVQAFDLDLTDLADGTLSGSKVQVQQSLTADGSGLKLSGDTVSPGNNKVYGTNGSGVRGWQAAASGDVAGPATATQHAAAAYADGSGKILQNTNMKYLAPDWHLDGGQLFLNDSKGLYWGHGSADWCIGRNLGGYATPHISGEALKVTINGSPSNGFAIGDGYGETYLEIEAWSGAAHFKDLVRAHHFVGGSGGDYGMHTGGYGGAILTIGGNAAPGGNGGNAGNVDTSGGSADADNAGGPGGYLSLAGGQAGGGYDGSSGGSIDLSASGSLPGGSIHLSGGGGSIDLRGSGRIEFGHAGQRTTLHGSGAGDYDIFLPAGGTTLVGTNISQVLTGKSMSGSANTFTNISLSTSVTGTLPVANGGTGLTSLGTGVATFFGTPSSANLASAVTGETGSGALVFATSPTLVTPVLGAATGASLVVSGDVTVATEVYDASGWNGDNTVPTKDAVRDKMETVAAQAVLAEIGVACSDEVAAVSTGTGKVTFRMPHGMTLTAVRASATTAPTGASLIVDINEGGASILSTKLSIDATEKTSTTATSAAVISDASLADDAEITIDFDQVGSSAAGAGVKIWLIGTR